MRQTLASIPSSSQSNREDIEYRSIGFGLNILGLKQTLSQLKNPSWRAAGKVLICMAMLWKSNFIMNKHSRFVFPEI